MLASESNWTAAAHTLAASAVLGFCAALGVLLCVVGVIVWRIQRYTAMQVQARLSPSALLTVCLSLGAIFILTAALAFWLLAESLGADHVISRFDYAFSDALRLRTSPATLRVFSLVTHFGDPLTLTLIAAGVALALYGLRRRWLALAWVLAISGNAVLNRALKEVFARLRPLDEHGYALLQGWSFPSGHTSGSVVTYGMLAYVAIRILPQRWHPPIVLLATTIAFATGCSRMFVYAHFPSDVLAGFLSGSAWLAVCIGSIELGRFYRRTPGQQTVKW